MGTKLKPRSMRDNHKLIPIALFNCRTLSNLGMALEASSSSRQWRPVAEFDTPTRKHGTAGSYSLERIQDDSVFADIQELAKHTYDGHDFITVMFHKWLKSAQTYLCGIRYAVEGGVSTPAVPEDLPSSQAAAAAETHDQQTLAPQGIIAFMLVDMLDAGTTAWLEGLRVHPAHRGQGLAKWISQLCAWQAEHLHGCLRIRYTTTTQNGASLAIASSLGMHQSAQWLFTAEKLTQGSPFVAALQEHASTEAADGISQVAPLEAAAALLSDLEPRPAVLIHDWVARQNAPETLTEWAATGVTVHAVGDNPSAGVSWSSTRSVFSGGTVYLCGVASASTPATLSHMLYHLHAAQEKEADALWCFTPHDQAAELESFGCTGIGSVGSVAQASPTCVMVERELSSS